MYRSVLCNVNPQLSKEFLWLVSLSRISLELIVILLGLASVLKTPFRT